MAIFSSGLYNDCDLMSSFITLSVCEAFSFFDKIFSSYKMYRRIDWIGRHTEKVITCVSIALFAVAEGWLLLVIG